MTTAAISVASITTTTKAPSSSSSSAPPISPTQNEQKQHHDKQQKLEETLDLLHNIQLRMSDKGNDDNIIDTIQRLKRHKNNKRKRHNETTTTTTTLSDICSLFCRNYLSLPSSSSSYHQNQHHRHFIIEAMVRNNGPDCDLPNLSSLIQSLSHDDDSLISESSQPPRLFSLDDDDDDKRKDDDDDDDDIATKTIRRLHRIDKLRRACTPRYESIMALILSEAERDVGMTFVVQLRADLLEWIKVVSSAASPAAATATTTKKKKGDEETEEGGVGKVVMVDKELMVRLRLFNDDLKRLLSLWFGAGILELRRITYDNTSASIMEKIATREAVHPIRSLAELRRRLGPRRRCFAFFHPSLPDEPLVFVHVALLPRIPSSMRDIDVLSDEEKEDSDDDDDHDQRRNDNNNNKAAIFYSITNTQPGLSGVDLGNLLIKRVVKLLKNDFDTLDEFATLSPIPRFRRWAEGLLNQHYNQSNSKFGRDDILTVDETMALAQALGRSSKDDDDGRDDEVLPEMLLREALSFLSLPSGDRHKNNNNDEQRRRQQHHHHMSSLLQPILMRLAARYLTIEKHHGRPLDNVAKFHIRNGAEMYRLNYMADVDSPRGMRNSWGIMVNYRYRLEDIEVNAVRYEMDDYVKVCEGVTCWLRGGDGGGGDGDER